MGTGSFRAAAREPRGCGRRVGVLRHFPDIRPQIHRSRSVHPGNPPIISRQLARVNEELAKRSNPALPPPPADRTNESRKPPRRLVELMRYVESLVTDVAKRITWMNAEKITSSNTECEARSGSETPFRQIRAVYDDEV